MYWLLYKWWAGNGCPRAGYKSASEKAVTRLPDITE